MIRANCIATEKKVNMNRSQKYDIKNICDQFGNSVPEYYEDPNETLAIDEVERIALLNEKTKNPVMIECGSDHAYYSMLWKKILPNSTNVLIEPFDKHMELGKAHFSLNKLDGIFLLRTVGKKWAGAKGVASEFEQKDPITFLEIMRENNLTCVHLLHCDIDGCEIDMLKCNEDVFKNKLIHNIVVMTHGILLHKEAREIILNHGYTITKDHPDQNIGWDGMIVASANL